MPTPFEDIARQFSARVERLNSWVPLREVRRREFQNHVRDALMDSARVFVLHGDRAHRDRGVLRRNLWDTEQFLTIWPPSLDQLATMGGVRAVYRRISEGSLGIDGRLGIWNGGFFHGLRLSGALRPYGGRQWVIWDAAHRELVRDMEGMGVFNRLERKTGKNGIRRLRRCPASYLPPEPPQGASVVAGLFAGSQIRRYEDENWMELPEVGEIIQQLDKWGIMWRPGRTFRGRGTILVPPFYAPLFIDLMPTHTMAGLLAVREPALCPVLPAIYWDLSLSGRGMPVIPFKGALPFSCSKRSFRRWGWKRQELHLMAVRMGINRVDQRLRERMVAWYEARVRMREERIEVPDALPVVVAPGIDPGPVRSGPGTGIADAGMPI